MGEQDGPGPGAGAKQGVGRRENGFFAAGQAGIDQHPAGPAGFDEIDVDKALNAQLGDAVSYGSGHMGRTLVEATGIRAACRVVMLAEIRPSLSPK